MKRNSLKEELISAELDTDFNNSEHQQTKECQNAK